MKILMCQLRNHGDIIRTFPVIDAIKKLNSNCYIGFTCYKEMYNTCKLNKNIDEVFIQPRFKPVTKIEGGTRILDCSILTEVVDNVKKNNFDAYIDFHGVFQSAAFGAMCNISRRIGRSRETAKDGADLFYNEIVAIHKMDNKMERHLNLAKSIFPKLIIEQQCNYFNNEIISIFPGSSKVGVLKRWDIDSYHKLALILSKNHNVEIIITPEDIELKERLQVYGNYKIKIIKDWNSILSQVNKSKMVIGNDGAFTHMSIWRNIPTIMILGPTPAAINGIWKYGIGKNITPSIECKCPQVWEGICNNNHACIKSIPVDYVVDEVNKIII